MSQAEVPDSLFTSTAWLMLLSAHNSNSEDIVEKSASLILQHARKDSLPHQVLQEAATQMAERLLVTFHIERADHLLREYINKGGKSGIVMQLLWVLTLRIKERSEGDLGRQSDEVLQNIEIGSEEDMEDAKNM